MDVGPVSGSPLVASAVSECLLPNYRDEIQGLTTGEKIKKLTTFFEEAAPKGNKEAMIRILACYGQVLYEEKAERESALRVNSTALMLLVDMGYDQVFFSRLCSSKLDDCENDLFFVEKTLREMSPHKMEEKVRFLTPEKQLLAARILRFIEHSYQNLSSYQKLPREDNDLFEQTVGMARVILENLLQNTSISDPARKAVEDELFELEYNTYHYLYMRKQPGDTAGVCQMLRDLKDRYGHDPEKQSRLCNLLSCHTPQTEIEERYKISKQALQIKQQNPHLFNGFAHAMNKSNFVCTALRHQGRSETDDDLLKLQQEAVDYVNGQIAQENYHDYFPLVFINQTKLFMYLERKEEAKKACEMAEMVLQKCEEPDESEIQACALLKELLK